MKSLKSEKSNQKWNDHIKQKKFTHQMGTKKNYQNFMTTFPTDIFQNTQVRNLKVIN